MILSKKLYSLTALNIFITLVVAGIGVKSLLESNPETNPVVRNYSGLGDLYRADMMHDALRGDAL